MYYEEKFFNGYWWFRNSSDGIWYKFTYEQLLHKCIEFKRKLDLELKHNEMFKSINSYTIKV